MTKPQLLRTDSIQELAEFWNAHDLTYFEDELEDVGDPAFARGAIVNVSLEAREVEAVEQIAQDEHVSREGLIRTWVLQKLARDESARPA